jgi:ankyrin repeat protein/glyoxylase-like metal-dependent hydrolase (beta-lactamase superfamily II)
VKYLIEHGAEVNARDDYQSTPLHFAAYRGLTESMKILLENGAQVDAQNHSESTPLHYAALADRTEAVTLLIAAEATLEIPDDYGRTALILCAREEGGWETAKALIAAGADVNSTDKNGDDSLELAAWRGKEEMVNLLIENGAKLPKDGLEAQIRFRYAAEGGLTRLFTALLQTGANPNIELADGGTLTHLAAAGGSIEILQGLAPLGLDLEASDDFGWTPLHYAARDGHVGCVQWLCEKKVDTDARSLMGQTPYNVAVERNMQDAAEVLKAAGADTEPMRFPHLEGPYLGQEPPGAEPKLFARGIVSSIWSLHGSISFSPDGQTVFWSPMPRTPGDVYSRSNVAMMTRDGGKWSAPEWAPFTGEDRGDVAFFSPDGNRVYFLSRRTLPEEPSSGTERIWYSDRVDGGWAPARLAEGAVNEYPQHWQFSVDGDGTIYFSADMPDGQGGGDIYRSIFADGAWQTPINIGPTVNTESDEATPYIAPDGSYLILQRSGDLYLSRRTETGGWAEPQALDETINTEARELCPIVSPDWKYLFFLRREKGGLTQAWWVEADFTKVNSPGLPQAETANEVTVKRLSDRAMVLNVPSSQSTNIIALNSEEGIVVIDTEVSPVFAREIRNRIEGEFGSSTFRAVINTHGHGDHTYGNQVFGDAEIIGHSTTEATMEAAEDRRRALAIRLDAVVSRLESQLASAEPGSNSAVALSSKMTYYKGIHDGLSEGFELTPPTVTLEESMVLDLGDLSLEISWFGKSHSDDDLLIYCPEEKLLATGDVFAPGQDLYVDSERIGHFDRWIDSLETIASREDDIEFVIPGHGEFLKLNEIGSQLAFVRDQKQTFEGRKSAFDEFKRVNQSQGLEQGLATLRKLNSNSKAYYLIHSELDSFAFEIMMEGRVDEALEIFRVLAELFPENDVAFDSLGEALVRLDEPEQAASAFRRALEINPENRNSARRLSEFQGG